jgi:hypothetical protein
MTSVEFPNTFYTFSNSLRQNTRLAITEYGPGDTTTHYFVGIDDGNYTTAQLVSDIQAQLPSGYSITLGPRTNKITISNNNPSPKLFTLSFSETPHLNPNGNGIGYNLGFIETSYSDAYSYTAESVPDTIQDRYVYLVINDYSLISHPIFGQTFLRAFAKITLTGVKNDIVFDNNYTNSSTKIYYFQQPTNVTKFEIKFIDVYGNLLDLNGANVSITLEVEEVLDSTVYENLIQL